MRQTALFARLGAALLVLVLTAAAQESTPGLVLEFHSLVTPATGPKSDRRVARQVGLHVEARTPYSPFLEPGACRATWSGFLRIDRRDNYTFSFEGRGSLEVEIDGSVVLTGSARKGKTITGKAVRLKKGQHVFKARYSTPISGSAVVRLSWQNRNFGLEPVPPRVFSHTHDPSLDTLRAGRWLIAERRCLACHRDPVRSAVGTMPELAMQGPDFTAIGSRRHAAWLAEWIADPAAVRHDARMPKLLHGASAAQDARDLASWLATLSAPLPPTPTGDAAQGGVLWKELGCFSCHTRPGHPDEDGFVSLTGVNHKFKPGALTAFLRAPRTHDSWIRMPDFRLEQHEAAALAAFLRSGQKPGTSIEGDATRGASLAAQLGCASCHAGSVDSTLQTKSLAELEQLNKGCLGADPATRNGAPDFAFTSRERDQLRQFLAIGRASLARTCAPEFASRQVIERRCTACHVLDGRTSEWTTRSDLADDLPDRRTGSEHVEVAQNRPALTEAGEKLQSQYLEKIIAGKTPSPRPWLHARMPSFPNLAPLLARGLAAQHGFSTKPEPATAKEFVTIGKQLAHVIGGFACVTCHAVGSQEPTALFEVQGINFTAVGERLRSGYYRRWMADPTRIDPAAKMPKYANDRGKTAFEELDGDAAKQFEAIWQYLRALR